MAAKEMYDYLSSLAADYTAVELTVSPSRVITEFGEKTQVVHEFDDGNSGIVTISGTSRFKVQLQWDALSYADAGSILDMWHDAAKANGLARSFYWPHTKDGHTYTVKFLGPLSRAYSYDAPAYQDVKQITLAILGYKPVS